MSYQIVQNPTSIGDIFGTLANELTNNGYTVERTSEVVGAETCISWTDGSGLWFHVDWDGSDIMYTSMSTGYVAGTLGRSQVDAQTTGYTHYRIQFGYSSTQPTTIIVTDDLVYFKQYYSEKFSPAFQFSKSYFYSKGVQWCSSASSTEFLGLPAPITELCNRAYSSIYNSGVVCRSRLVYFDGVNIVLLSAQVYSDTAFCNISNGVWSAPNYSDNRKDFLSNMLVTEYYSTLAKPLRLYIAGQPFAKLNDRIVVGRGDNLLDNQIVQIAGDNYIKTYQRTLAGFYIHSIGYTKEAVLVKYN